MNEIMKLVTLIDSINVESNDQTHGAEPNGLGGWGIYHPSPSLTRYPWRG